MNGVGRNNQSPVIQIGTILEPPPNIKVRYKSIILEAAECYISEYLLTQYKRSAEGNIKQSQKTQQEDLVTLNMQAMPTQSITTTRNPGLQRIH